MSGRRIANDVPASYVRYQGVATLQTAKSTPGILRRIVVSNADAAVQTVTVTDGAAVLGVFKIPPADTRVLQFDVRMVTSIKITPSDTDLDMVVVYD